MGFPIGADVRGFSAFVGVLSFAQGRFGAESQDEDGQRSHST